MRLEEVLAFTARANEKHGTTMKAKEARSTAQQSHVEVHQHCNCAFVTAFLGDKRFSPGVSCLMRRLVAVGTRFPLVIIHDNATRALLPHPPAAGLSVRPIEIEQLRQRTATPADNTPDHARTSTFFAAGRRRLFQTAESQRTREKLLVWALVEYDKVMMLDADVYIASNVDVALHTLPPTAPLAASPGCEPRFFNSGVMIARPNISELERVLRVRPHIPRCESLLTDQSILNKAFPRWVALQCRVLTVSLASAGRAAHARLRLATDTTWELAHFVGEPKPWRHLARCDGRF